MTRSLILAATIGACLALAACATTPQTYQEKLDVATTTMSAVCDAAKVLTASGDLHGQDAERAVAACTVAQVVLADLQASAPPAAGAASSPG